MEPARSGAPMEATPQAPSARKRQLTSRRSDPALTARLIESLGGASARAPAAESPRQAPFACTLRPLTPAAAPAAVASTAADAAPRTTFPLRCTTTHSRAPAAAAAHARPPAQRDQQTLPNALPLPAPKRDEKQVPSPSPLPIPRHPGDVSAVGVEGEGPNLSC